MLLGADLASIYGVPTKRLNEQVKRNADRFPEDFRLQLTRQKAVNISRSSQFERDFREEWGLSCGMQIHERAEQGITILSVEGRLDYQGAGDFQTKALALVNGGVRWMLIDFGGTSFLASMGIRAIMIPYQEISKAGGKLAITGLSPELQRLFETAGLHKLFTIFPSVEAALADGSWPGRTREAADGRGDS